MIIDGGGSASGVDRYVLDLINRTARGVGAAAFAVVGAAFPIRVVEATAERPVAYVGSDDPESLVREFGTESKRPSPWGGPALERVRADGGGARS